MTLISALPTKTTPVADDSIILTDSAAASATKKATLVNLASSLQSLQPREAIFIASSLATPAEIAYATAANRCDGVDDHVQIQAALNLGGTIYLSSGTFFIGAMLTDNNASAKVFCRPDTVIYMTNGKNLNALLNLNVVNDFEWHDGIFDGNRANNTHAGFGLITVTGTCNGIMFESLTVRSSDAQGIHIDGATPDMTPLHIRFCTIYDCDNEGIGGSRDHMVINGCDISQCGSLPTDGSHNGFRGIMLTGDHFEIFNNRIVANKGIGIEVKGSEADHRWLTGGKIVGNTVENNTSHGIRTEWASGITITGNRCCNNGNNGIEIDHSRGLTVSANACSFNGSTRGSATNWNYEGNGIYIYRSRELSVTANICISNSQGQCKPATDHRSGIRVSSLTTDNQTSRGLTITGNVCNDQRVTGSFTCRLGAVANTNDTTLTIDTLSSTTFTFEGPFTMSLGNEFLVVTQPTINTTTNCVTPGVWTVIRARDGTFTNRAEPHQVAEILTLQRSQMYGVDLNRLDADDLKVTHYNVSNNICQPNVVGGVRTEYSLDTGIISGNIE